MSDSAPPVLHLKNTGNPDLETEPIRFQWLDFYNGMAVRRRMVELANTGARAGAIPIKVEQLDPEGQYMVEAIATLEYVIDTAPKGFYTETNGRAVLAPARLLDVHGDVIVEAYTTYVQARAAFRDALRSAARGTEDASALEADGDGGDQGGSGPAERAGDTGTV